MRILFLALLLVLVGCKTSESVSPEGHNCSQIQVDSIFIEGDHICFPDQCLCSYEDPNWFVYIVE